MAVNSKRDELPPSYEETQSAHDSTAHMLSGPGIVSEIEFRRQEIVRSTIEQHILPALRRQARYGIVKSITVLEPHQPAYGSSTAEKTGKNSANQPMDAIVSHDGENLIVAQLDGEVNSVEFWSQASALEELQRQLHDILCASTLFDGVEFQSPRKSGSEAKPPRESKSWGSKLKREAGPPRDEIMLAHPPKNSNGVQLSVQWEDVVRRTENDFGLFENSTKPGVVVRVEVLG